MSRHRALSLDDGDYESDDYDDYGSSYDGSYGVSPSMSQYMYNRNQQQKMNLGSLVNNNTKRDDKQLVADCLKYIEEYAGKNAFPYDEIVDAIRKNDYNADATLDYLYDQYPEEDVEPELPQPTTPTIQIKMGSSNKKQQQQKNKNNKKSQQQPQQQQQQQKQQPQQKQPQQPQQQQRPTVTTTPTKQEDDIPDAALMKSLGRGLSISSGVSTSSKLSSGRGVGSVRGSLTQGRGRGTLSIGRGRGVPVGLTRQIHPQTSDTSSDEEGEESDDEEEDDNQKSDNVEKMQQHEVISSLQKLSINEQQQQQSSSHTSDIGVAAIHSIQGHNTFDDQEESQLPASHQTKPSPLAHGLIQQLTDSSFVYYFLKNKPLTLLDEQWDHNFKFDQPSPDDVAFAAREQSKISHKAENSKFKPIVKQQAAKVKPTKSALTVQLDTSNNAENKEDISTSPLTPFSIVTKGVAPKDEHKQRINVVIIGHVDAGKSTLMGHLLVQTGMVSDKLIHKYKKESQEKGKASFAFAWVLDEHPEERDRGVTIDIGVRYFQTANKHVTILDAPGHRDFIPNMITGASQADVAILVVDASPGNFESGFQNGGQTKEHLILARSLGVSEVLVVVNKLDVVGWSKDRFDEICEQIGIFMKQIGYRADKDVSYIPASGLNGINLLKKASQIAEDKKDPSSSEAAKLTQWYNGPSLVEFIDQFNPPNRDVDKPFRMSINDVYKTMATGVTVAGRVDTGHVTTDEQLLLMPLNELCVVKTIMRHKENVQTAYAGDNIELGLAKIEQNKLNVGDILCEPAHPIKIGKRFEARIVTFELDVPITKGAQVILHMHNVNLPAIISRLKCTLNKHQEVLKKKPRVLPNNTTAIVEIKLSDKKQVVPIERFADFPSFGRFTLRSGGKTVAAGLVNELIEKSKK